MEDMLRDAIEKQDLLQVMNCIESKKEALNKVWGEKDHKNVETTLRLLIQEIESIKNDNPSLEEDISYHLGRLDGFIESYEEVYRAEKQMEVATEVLSENNDMLTKILQCLYDSGREMSHSELAKAVGCTNNELKTSMKKILLSGTVRYLHLGKNTTYYITEVGKRYVEYSKNE